LDSHLTLEVAPFLHVPETSKNGTTSTKEISTDKSAHATLHKRVPFISGLDIYSKYKVYEQVNIGHCNYT
jgi:hypothetical protein